ncbi:MAG: type II toxin-antitoxin system RelE/ParE family toxin [Planctomycetota bacterium]
MSDPAYEVLFTEQATRDFDEQLAFYTGRSPEAGRKWCDAVESAVIELESHPERFTRATEHDRLGSELRQLNFGVGRRLSHRMVYRIRESGVVIYAIRHLAQRMLDDPEI